ncbi:MAG TPA: DUF1080 domain-containing protein [Candidatus Hydrogenedentes bacterium]|nr:DUF1080 domain-containing protein [Candidatus Hydrogenedentota bacterium]HPG65503.1 DUF1080 domain-containing protein [Candidatus Hydrogenedentota bacterium]
MKRTQVTWIGLILLAVALAPSAMAADVTEFLARMPAQSVADGEMVNAELVAMGPDAVKQLCAMLVPPGGDDVNVRYALSGLAKYVSLGSRGDARTMVEGAFLAGLDAAQDAEVKAFLMRQLGLAGTAASVAPLAAYLGDDRLCEPATQALTAIGGPEATAALLGALDGATGARRATIIKALGELRCAVAAAKIVVDAASEDWNTRWTALYALAEIADPLGAEALATAAGAETPYARSKATALYLRFARRLAENGDAAACEKICREIMAARIDEPNVQVDALSLLVDALGEAALADLLAALDSDYRAVRYGALEWAARIPGAPATAKWVEKAAQAPAPVRGEIVAMLGLRGDATALPFLLDSVKDSDAAVHLAAIDAAALLGEIEAVPALLDGIKAYQEDTEVAAIRAALLRIGGDEFAALVGAALAATPAPGRKALLEVLAIRAATSQKEAVFAQAVDADESVRVAAAKALKSVAGAEDQQRLIDLLVAAQSDGECVALREAIVAVAGSVEPAEQRAAVVLAAQANASGEARARLLAVLPGLGGAAALDAVVADTKSADESVRAAAVRALSEWPTVDASPALLDVANATEDLKLHVIAIRGYLRLAASAPDNVAAYKAALDTARRPDEQKIALGGLADVRTDASLALVASFLDNEALRSEAVSAAVAIACPRDDKDAGLRGAGVFEALNKALAVAADADTRAKIQAHLTVLGIPAEFNLALGKAVATSVEQQGDHAPEQAVDGTISQESAWFGASWPSWLQVDLGENVRINRVRPIFYWGDGRYYQYTVETSTDGENWTLAADMSQNGVDASAEGVLHTFAVVDARYVRLNVLKNSINEAVHVVELQVYGELTPVFPPPLAAPDDTGFTPLFNGTDLTGWEGDTTGYVAEDGLLACKPGGNLYTDKDYANFILRFEFLLTPGANNGLAVRVPMPAHAAYDGMELQILDNTAEQYRELQPYQYHGSVYGIVPAKRGFLKPVGEWNYQEVIAQGRHITVNLNGTTIVDADLEEATADGPMDHKDHPGLKRDTGRLGFCGHGSVLWFRNLRIKELE